MQTNNDSKTKEFNIAGKLAKIFLHNPLTLVFAFFILSLGVVALQMMPKEENPKIAISAGNIIIPAPGLNPQEVQKNIVEPLEEKLREITNIKHIYSTSMNNMAVVNIVYNIGADREKSNVKLYDKIMQNMDSLPANVRKPIVKPFDIDISIPIVTIAFYQKEQKIPYKKFLSTLEDMQLAINALDNVSKTALRGEQKEQYNVEVDMNKLNGYHLSLGQISAGIQSIALKMPNVDLKTTKNERVIMSMESSLKSIEDIKNLIVAEYMGTPVYLKDVARVSDGVEIQKKQRANIRLADGKKHDLITLEISKLGGTNAVSVSEDIKEYLAHEREHLEDLGIAYKVTRDYGKRANEAVDELAHHILVTVGIIFIMLIVFLGWRESLIVSFTVPAVLAITLFVAYMSGQTINRITLFAFLLSLGILVDAGIIVIENIHRHMHSKESKDKTLDEIIIEATNETGNPTNIATFAIVLTMIPMVFVGGMMGSFMKPIPLNVPVALIASLFVAYIFVPYLSRKLLKREQDTPKER